MKRLAPLVLLLGGCVQVAIVTDRSHGGRTQHQDIARTTSSTQSADGALEVPVSLVPK